MVGFHFFNFYVCIVSMLFFAVLKVCEKWGDKRTMPPMLQPVRVAAKIFVFVILVNFRELFISCFARFSLNVAKHEIKFWVIICDISHKKKIKLGQNYRHLALHESNFSCLATIDNSFLGLEYSSHLFVLYVQSDLCINNNK